MEDKWTIVDGELYHHGILGQRWGHRNGPPYPLDRNDYSEAEKRGVSNRSIRRMKRAKATQMRNENFAHPIRNDLVRILVDSCGSAAMRSIAMGTNSQVVKTGANIVTTVLNVDSWVQLDHLVRDAKYQNNYYYQQNVKRKAKNLDKFIK